ncbi:MAG TPA: hypothetical protein VH374_18300 [Polyangia bacterium]|nr:hypothetical protein [Polyangia bacterium]
MFRLALTAATTFAAVVAGGCSLNRDGLGAVDALVPIDDTSLPSEQGQLGCTPCGPCEICGSDGTCQIDPASRWEIVCVSAGIAAAPPDGDKWDPEATTSAGAAPDPYCQFDTLSGGDGGPDTTDVTTTLADTFTPTWNQVITPAGQTISAADLLDPPAMWSLTVIDDDDCDSDQGCVAETICTLSPPMNASWLADGSVSTAVAPSCSTLTLRLVCQP